MNTRELKQLIQDAFGSVVLGNGLGLWQAQGIDDYASDEELQRLRDRDEKLDWSKIDSETLFRCDSSLSFFDAEGMRFHLPAFLMMEVNGETSPGLFYHLTRLDDFMLEKYSLLSEQQRCAISEFLNWQIDQGFMPHELDVVLWAQDYFWKKTI